MVLLDGINSSSVSLKTEAILNLKNLLMSFNDSFLKSKPSVSDFPSSNVSSKPNLLIEKILLVFIFLGKLFTIFFQKFRLLS